LRAKVHLQETWSDSRPVCRKVVGEIGADEPSYKLVVFARATSQSKEFEWPARCCSPEITQRCARSGVMIYGGLAGPSRQAGRKRPRQPTASGEVQLRAKGINRRLRAQSELLQSAGSLAVCAELARPAWSRFRDAIRRLTHLLAAQRRRRFR
jgi:hypothetical protein